MLQRLSFLLLYSTLILISITFCNGGKPEPGRKEKKKLVKNEGDDDEGNANAIKFLHLIHPHFEQFGTPFELLEQEKDYIMKRNGRTRKVEWRLAEVNRNRGIQIDEFSMLDVRKAGIEKKLFAAMTEYANCVKKLEKMKIETKDKTTKIFMLNGAITILDLKPIAGKRHAFRVKYVPEFLDEEQILDVLPTHFCTSLFIVENWKKIGENELVCTRIGQWTEKDGPPRNIGKMKDCGHSEMYDRQLDEHLVSSGAESMLEFLQIKLAMDLTKMLKRLEAANLVERRKHKEDDQNVPTASITSADEHQIESMDPNLRIYKGFMVEYDPRKFVANWLLERLTIENASSKNQTKRLNLNWNADPKLAKMFQPVEEDYKIAKQFKLNHGHLAGFRAHRENDGQETFLYPNSVPQDREINSGYWRVIEEYTLCLAGHKQSIAYIYTGPLFIPEENKDIGQWQMKYKIIGKRKMMAVPTHLFKIIFLEFSNENDGGKKTFWLENFVVSNGQEDEEEEDEENVEGREEDEELFQVDEEEEGITVEVEMENNIWHNLAKDEAEIDKILKESQKPDKGKDKIPEITVNVKKTEDIKSLVKGCQNRSYKIVYGDEKRERISELLKRHREPLNYIDKFAPNFKLLAKLPFQLRKRKNGALFDENDLVKLITKNEKGKDKAEESVSSDEKVEKIKSEKGGEATSHSKKFTGSAKEKGIKSKGGKSKKKETPAAAAELKKSGGNFYEEMEKFYTEYLMNSKHSSAAQSHIRNIIQLKTCWHSAQSLLELVKVTMEAEGNKIGAAQINDIDLEFNKVIEEKKFMHIDEILTYNFNEATKLVKIGICWLIHLRESIFYTYFSALSHQKSSNLQNIMALEQQRFKSFGILLGIIKRENYIFSKYDDGTRIAQIWMESADHYCRPDEPQFNEFLKICKFEMNNLQYMTFHKMLSMENGEFVRKYQNFVEMNGGKSVAVTRAIYKVLTLLGVHLFKKLTKEFPNLFIIAHETFYIIRSEIFRDAIFDVQLFEGYYQGQKHALLDILHIFDYYTLMESIEQSVKEYDSEIRNASAHAYEVRRQLFRELNVHKQQFHKQLSKCRELESSNNERSSTLGQALEGRCILDVFCRVQNLFSEIIIKNEDKTLINIEGKYHYYGLEECEQMQRNVRGELLIRSLQKQSEFNTDFIEKYTNIYNESTKNLIKWAFDIREKIINENVDDKMANVPWLTNKLPSIDLEFRKQQFVRNVTAEKIAEKNLIPLLLDDNFANWLTIQSVVLNIPFKGIIALTFKNFQPTVVKLAKKEIVEDENALDLVINAKKFLTLEKIFRQIIELKMHPIQELCHLLVLNQHLLFTMGNMEDEFKNSEQFQNIINDLGEIHNSNMAFDEDVTSDKLITLEYLNLYCQNVERRQKLFRKNRFAMEAMAASELQVMFFTNKLGMADYHLAVELPGKLIKIAGIEGFMDIAQKHPLIMTNFVNTKTVQALLFRNGFINFGNNNEIGEQQRNLEENERKNRNEEKKISIMLDLILFQLKLAQNAHLGEPENMLTNEELEERNKIERAKTKGMDILMEWLDNSNMEKPKEEMEEYMNKMDEKAYLAIGQLIIGNEEDPIPGWLEVGIVANTNSPTEMPEEKWRKEWRKSTSIKLMKLEEKMNAIKGKEKEVEEEEKGKNAENIASSSSSSLQH